MRFDTVVLGAWFITLVSVVAQALLAWETLPERVASHFGGDGVPNGWMQREQFLGIWIGVTVLCNSCVALPAISMRTIPDLVSIPNRRFWLSTPERRVRATRVLTGTVAACIALTNLALYLAFEVVETHAHTGKPVPFPAGMVLGLLGAILVVALVYPVVALKREKVL
ncbi:MAG: putative membrane protein [Myxococcota bacterium]|jgi:uncharacterized membrane protein